MHNAIITLTRVQINENGIFVAANGAPLDRSGMPIDGQIDITTGYIIGFVNGTGLVAFGPNGQKLPVESLSPQISVGPDGVPRNAWGAAPLPCGRMSAGCVGPPGATISEYGIPVTPNGLPLLRDGAAIPGAQGFSAGGFIMGPAPEVRVHGQWSPFCLRLLHDVFSMLSLRKTPKLC